MDIITSAGQYQTIAKDVASYKLGGKHFVSILEWNNTIGAENNLSVPLGLHQVVKTAALNHGVQIIITPNGTVLHPRGFLLDYFTGNL